MRRRNKNSGLQSRIGHCSQKPWLMRTVQWRNSKPTARIQTISISASLSCEPGHVGLVLKFDKGSFKVIIATVIVMIHLGSLWRWASRKRLSGSSPFLCKAIATNLRLNKTRWPASAASLDITSRFGILFISNLRKQGGILG